MTRHFSHALKWISVAIAFVGLGGCLGDRTAKASPSGNTPSNGWVTECAGRWLVDVPGPIDFGAVPPQFVEAGNTYYRFADTDGLGNGSMSIAGVRWYETAPIASLDDYGYVDVRANAAFRNYMRGGSTDEEQARRRSHTTKIVLGWSTAFLWHKEESFDFGIYVAEDKRARMMHGSLARSGSATKAKAIVESLWPRYRPRKPGEAPTDAGICTPYGFFADPNGSTEQDYLFSMSFRDSRHNNLLLSLGIETRSDKGYGRRISMQPTALSIEDEITPWEREIKRAKEEKEKCRPQQGTASRDVSGCMFAGTRTIKSHREVEYLTLVNGQKARLLVIEYHAVLAEGTQYSVAVETVGTPDSATEPRILIEATGYGPKTDNKAMQGKNPPTIEEAIAVVKALAQSLRPRPGAITPNAPVKDSLAGLR